MKGAPVFGKPGGQGDEPPEGREVHPHQGPGLPHRGGEFEALRHGPFREQLLAQGLRPFPGLLGGQALAHELEVPGIAAQQGVGPQADHQKGKPGQVGAGQTQSRDRHETQEQGEDSGGQIADSGVAPQGNPLAALGEPVRGLADPDRKGGDAAAPEHSETQEQRKQPGQPRSVQAQQTVHPRQADNGQPQKDQERAAAPGCVDHGGEGNPQQGLRKARNRHQEPGKGGGQPRHALQVHDRRPEQRDRRKPDEEPEGGPEQPLSRVPQQAQRRSRLDFHHDPPRSVTILRSGG